MLLQYANQFAIDFTCCMQRRLANAGLDDAEFNTIDANFAGIFLIEEAIRRTMKVQSDYRRELLAECLHEIMGADNEIIGQLSSTTPSLAVFFKSVLEERNLEYVRWLTEREALRSENELDRFNQEIGLILLGRLNKESRLLNNAQGIALSREIGGDFGRFYEGCRHQIAIWNTRSELTWSPLCPAE